MNYEEIKTEFAKARCPEKGKPLHYNNTRIFKEGTVYKIKLWDTFIMTYCPDGTIGLNSNGWRTVTTKGRMNEYLPNGYGIYQENKIWYLTGTDGEDKSVFFDGVKIKDKKILNPTTDDLEGKQKKLTKMVNKYIRGFAKDIKENGLKDPSGGDCWPCCMAEAETGKTDMMGYDHLLSHFEQKYYVPSLLANAIKEKGYKNPGFIWHMIKSYAERGEECHLTLTILRSYFLKRNQKLLEPM